MVNFNNPEDILGIGIKTILSYRKDDDDFKILIENWEKKVIVEFEGIYAVTVSFSDGTISINYGSEEEFDLMIKLKSIKVMTDLASGKYGPIVGFLKGKVKVKKIWNLRTLLKFLKIFIPALKIAGDQALRYKNEEELLL